MSASATASSYRLKVRFGNSDFEAEGPTEIVTEAYQGFLTAVTLCPAETPRVDVSEEIESAGQTHREGYPSSLLERAFIVDGESVSLRSLPSSDKGDALVLLIYGYRTLVAKQAVTGNELASAARQSGLALNRVDRFIPEDYVMRGGSGNAKRYHLNNRGIEYAENMLEQMFH